MKSVYMQFLDKHGITGSDAEFDSLVGPPLAEVIATLQDNHVLAGDLEELLRTYGDLIDKTYRDVRPCAGAHQLLDWAKQAGWVIGVVTSSSRVRAEGWIAAVGFSDHVSVVIGGDDVEFGKPSPEPYLNALATSGCDAAFSVAVEDSRQGATAAVAAGLQTFVVNTEVDFGWPAAVQPVFGLVDLVWRLKSILMDVFPLQPGVELIVTSDAPALSEGLDARIAEIWTLEKNQRQSVLFNGLIYCIEAFDDDQILGHFEEYRRIIGVIRDAEVRNSLDLWSLGVSGVLQCRDGLVFGLRGVGNTYDQGLWETVPSGGVADECLDQNGNPDPKAQLLAELVEEVGLSANDVQVGSPFLLIKNIYGFYFDMGFELTTDLDGPIVLEAYANLDNDEYTQINIVPIDEIADFVSAHSDQMAVASMVYLQHLKLFS